jgi:2-polyprenyl-3-methyl-5-hydroxy-6-metoxy-1,4-benzoquinol methylase
MPQPPNPVTPDTFTVGTDNEARRDAWVRAALAHIPPGRRLLDAGAGEQRYRSACAHLQYVCQDFAAYDPAQSPTGLQVHAWHYGKLDHVCDITAIPEPAASFDAILCTEVLEHLPNPLAALHEFARLLRPAGTLLLTAPFCSITHFAPFHFATGFSRFWYETHLQAAGFAITELTPNGNWFDYLAQEVRRTSQISTRYADLAPTPEEKSAMKQLLAFLQRCTDADHGSAELLCFGFHLHATRT